MNYKLSFKDLAIIGGMSQKPNGEWIKVAYVDIDKGKKKIGVFDFSKLTTQQLSAAMQCYMETMMPMLENLQAEAEKRGLVPHLPPMPGMSNYKGEA